MFKEKIKKVKDIIEYDGPILSHFKDENGSDILFYWVDFNEKTNRWLVWKVSDKILNQYLNKEKDLKQVLFDDIDNNVYLIDIDKDINWVTKIKLSKKDIPLDYIPEDDSYLI